VTIDLITTKATVATAAIVASGFTLLSYVSVLEHERSVRPSTYLNLFLGLSTLLDIARVRTLFGLPSNDVVAYLYLASFCVKVLILSLEAIEKRSLLKQEWQGKAPEEVSGIYNRSLFLWLNKLISRGYRSVLTMDKLLPIDEELLSASRTTAVEERWVRGTSLGASFKAA